MSIRQLPEIIINRIAAGEVIERPASVVKELIENALDAHAQHIEITTAGGGLNLIRITDDGDGIPEIELPLAISRHCTSKLDDNISRILSLGFRGEALASIGSVSHLTLRSRTDESKNGAEILVENGQSTEVKPAALNRGTIVEIRNLFLKTPARLKFMKEERAEASAITEVLKKFVIAYPSVRFSLSGTDRSRLEFPAVEDTHEGRAQRIIRIMGSDFAENSLPIDNEIENLRLTGYLSLPRFNRSIASHQHVFVNGRCVRDRLISASIRHAYGDLLPRDRHPVIILFVSINPEDVDVNVHPTKADVRFKNPAMIRRFIISTINHTLTSSGVRPFSATTQGAMQYFFPKGIQSSETDVSSSEPNKNSRAFSNAWNKKNIFTNVSASLYPHLFLQEEQDSSELQSPMRRNGNNTSLSSSTNAFYEPSPTKNLSTAALYSPCLYENCFDEPLGSAVAQVHENYIISQTQDSIIIVDQHAAHERLLYETLKKDLESRPIPAQILLTPEIVELSWEEIEKFEAHAPILLQMGLLFEPFGAGALIVREIPAVLAHIEVKKIVLDLADEILENDTIDTIKKRLHEIISKIACYGSVRSGRRLKLEEMNTLLRQMEKNPSAMSCNHGRPTYVELRLVDIEKLFLRL